MWRRCGEAASARLSAAALYSVYSGLYSEVVVSSAAPAVAFVEVGRLREAVEYVQKAAKTPYEAARDVFEQVKVTAQCLVELFVEAVTRVLAWVDEHKAYLFLKAAVAAGAVALGVALNIWGAIELEKLAYAASLTPFVAGLVDTGGKVAERFKALYARWKAGKNEKQKMEEIINEIVNAPLKGERSFLKLAGLANLPPPLAELRKALRGVKGEVERDAAVVAALVLYKTLVNNAGAYGKWAELFEWARGLVERQVFTVAAGEIAMLRGSQTRLEEAAEQVRRELNSVLTLYSKSGFYKEAEPLNELKKHLKVDVTRAEELAEARSDELSGYEGVNMGTKAYAALLSIARGGIYGHVVTLLMGEGALADIVLSAPRTAYEKSWEIAKMRSGAVDPSRVEAAGWEDRAASVLLRFFIGYGEAELKFRRIEKDGKKGFQVFRTYGGIEAPVGELWIGDVARFNVSKEELRRSVEEAKGTAPDLSGLNRSRQYVEWRATDVTTVKRQIVGTTVHSWQLRWYFGLLGGPDSFSGSASVTKEGIKFLITARWPREREDQILRESRWLESLLGRRVESWRKLVDAIDWSLVLEKVGKLVDEIKLWIGPERMGDAEREWWVRRMLGELALLAHFAEARRVKNDKQKKEGAERLAEARRGMDDEWRAERAVRLAKAVEALSGGRIAGEHAERLAELIIRFAERREKSVKDSIDNLTEKLAGVSREEVWGVVEFVLGDMYCLARDCARDAVVRKFVAPALELIMLDKALYNEFDREEALLNFGEMYATAVAGDGTVGPKRVELAVGGELGGGAALLRLATLYLLNQLLPDGLKLGVRMYMGGGRYYNITATRENVARLKRLLAVSAPSAGGEYLSPKFKRFVEAAKVEVRPGGIRLTESGCVAADLTFSEGGAAVKYNVYLRNAVELRFQSSERGRVELAARLLRLAGVSAEVKKVGDEGEWRVVATTDILAAGRKELRDAIARLVETARDNGWVNADKAEHWLKKLKRGRVSAEGWPKYKVGLAEGALVVIFGSSNPDSIEREAQRLREVGLVESRHFTVKMPEEGRYGYVSILKEGLAYAAWLSVHGSDKQRRLAAEFVEYILQRAKEKGEEVYEKAREIIEKGRARGSLRLEGFEGVVEVNGRKHVVKVIGWGAELEESWSGKKLLRIRITAEVDGVEGDYTITYSRRRADNAAVGRAYASANAPGGREADAERHSALVKALTDEEPRVYRMEGGRVMIECGREHLDGFKRYAELADAIEKWLEETRR
ncbi:MAG: hypothetical protein LM559_00075 [Pyrobaculum sp.]|nr:hypothetical protein [Pyrobaculum sp.]